MDIVADDLGLPAGPGAFATRPFRFDPASEKAIAELFEGAITTTSTPGGAVSGPPISDEQYVIDIASGDSSRRDAYLTLSKPCRLVRFQWDQPGFRLGFNA